MDDQVQDPGFGARLRASPDCGAGRRLDPRPGPGQRHAARPDPCPHQLPAAEELVYLYRTRARLENDRRLFLEYIGKINQLKEQPEFYNTPTTNCTTDVWFLVRALSDQFPLDCRVLLSGHFPEYVYDIGSLDTRLRFAEL